MKRYEQILRLLSSEQLSSCQLALRLGCKVELVRPRISELKELGAIEDTEKRIKRHGNGPDEKIWKLAS